MDITTTYVKRDDTCSIAYSIRGHGPPVLFIQGVGVQGDGWLPQVEHLSARYTCITFDHRGLGQSEWKAPKSFTVEQLAEDALAVLQHSGHQQAHVIGHSLGGTVALALALRSSASVRSLSLLCTFASGKMVAPLNLRMIWLGMRARLGTRRMRRYGFLRIVLPPGPIRDAEGVAKQVSQLFGHDIADTPPIASQQLRALMKSELTDRLGEIKNIRSLIVSAEFDPIAPPKSGEAISDRLDRSRFVLIPDASHGLPITHAKALNAILEDFLAQESVASSR